MNAPTTDIQLAALLNEVEPQSSLWVADSVSTCEGYDLAVWTVEERTADEVLAAVRYFAVANLAMQGEAPDSIQEVVPGHLFVCYCDTTKSQRDDVADAFSAFAGFAVEGSPVRKTDRAGAGTKGTRAVQPIGPVLCAWN